MLNLSTAVVVLAIKKVSGKKYAEKISYKYLENSACKKCYYCRFIQFIVNKSIVYHTLYIHLSLLSSIK